MKIATASVVVAALALSGVSPRPGEAADSKPASTKPATSSKPAVVDSLGLLEHAVARDSSKWDNLSRLGLMYLDRDRPQDAERALRKASQIKPKDVPTIVNLGAAYDAMGKPKQAQEQYARALAITPDDVVAGCRMASSQYSAGQYDDAMARLRKLVATNPKAYCAYFTLGVAFADAGIYKEAVRMWKKVVELAPDSPEALSAKESIDVLERVLQSGGP